MNQNSNQNTIYSFNFYETLYKGSSDKTFGDFISYSNIEMHKKDGHKKRFTFAGSIYFNRMKEKEFYTIDKDVIRRKVEDVDLIGVYDKKIL